MQGHPLLFLLLFVAVTVVKSIWIPPAMMPVYDSNDHCPTLTSDLLIMCVGTESVIVNARDEDPFPNGPPLTFAIVPEGTQGQWQVDHLNDTAVTLRAPMGLGIYEVEFVVTDMQEQACPEPQKVMVQVCGCDDGSMCGNNDLSPDLN